LINYKNKYRYEKPYDENILAEMEELGEKEYTKVNDKRNKEMMKIIKGIDFNKKDK
jgi:hypothetical protein